MRLMLLALMMVGGCNVNTGSPAARSTSRPWTDLLSPQERAKLAERSHTADAYEKAQREQIQKMYELLRNTYVGDSYSEFVARANESGASGAVHERRISDVGDLRFHSFRIGLEGNLANFCVRGDTIVALDRGGAIPRH